MMEVRLQTPHLGGPGEPSRGADHMASVVSGTKSSRGLGSTCSTLSH